MTALSDLRHAAKEPPGLSGRLMLLLAVAAGVSVANLYLAQPLTGLIGPAIGLPPTAYGLVVTLTQLGYVAGILLLVPLGDVVEDRRLMVATLGLGALMLLLLSLARTAAAFLTGAFAVGMASVATQMAIPMASHLARPETQGRQVAAVVSGLLTGILLSRPLASLIASIAGWQAVFVVSACLMVAVAAALWRLLPQRRPTGALGYGRVLRSMGPLLAGTPALRRRTAYHMALFLPFSVLWTALPLRLAGPGFGLGQVGIAVFSLVGAAGALSAPVAGRLADRGHVAAGTATCMAMVGASVLLTWPGAALAQGTGLLLLVGSVVLLDAGVQGHTVFAQKVLFGHDPDVRSRMNAVFIAGTFLSGAVGSALAPLALARGGWSSVVLLGAMPPLIALTFFVSRDCRGSRGQHHED